MPLARRRRPATAVVAGVVTALAIASPAAAADRSPAAAAAALCDGKPRTTGSLADPAMIETSGLAWSRAHRGLLWAHNDSGDTARIFALRRDGSSEGVVTVTGATAVDWEDIALGTGPRGRDSLFLGDIGGGGNGIRPSVAIHRIPEPEPPGEGATTASAASDRITLVYPDGGHDAEALLVDDRNGDLVVVTKGADADATVYRAAGGAVAPAGSTITLEAVGPVGQPTEVRAERLALELASLGDAADLVTGGDASAAGQVAVVRTYGGIAVFAWPTRRSLAETLTRVPCAAPAPFTLRAPQGEAVALAPNGRRLVTVSEGPDAPLVELRAAR